MRSLSIHIILVIWIFFLQSGTAVWTQNLCAGGRFTDSIYTQVDIQSDIPYFTALNCDSVWQTLAFDMYEPTGDTMQNRPVIIFAHGGSFVVGSKLDQDMVLLSTMAARFGYVGISLDYRVESIPHILSNPNLEQTFQEAVYRATIDLRELIKFLRNSVQNGNPYKINPNQIIVTGVSAGAIMADHAAFLDGVTEIPLQVNQNQLGTFDTVGNFPAISGVPNAIVSIAGGIGDTNWITASEQIPGLYIHGTIDSIVPYNSDSARLIGIPITYIHGSQSIYFRTQSEGIPSQLKLFPGIDHYGLGDSPTKDTIVVLITQFYSDLICQVGLGNNEPHSTGIRIYPNPAHSFLRLDIFADDAGKPIQIINAVGSVVYREIATEGSQQIALEGYPGGLYFLQLGEGRVFKFIVE